MPNPRHRVQGPTFTPAGFGLTAVATIVDDPDPHWRNGIQWETFCAGAAGTTLAPCYQVVDPEGDPGDLIDAEVPAKSGAVGAPWAEGDAVTVYAVARCSTVGRTREADVARAQALLTAGEGRALEAVVATGVTEAGTLARSLAGDAEPTGVAGGSLHQALASLEDALGSSYGGVGVIHMPRSVALLAVAAGLVVREGQRLVTGVGTLVAAGAGYAPEQPISGPVPVYASGAVVLYRGGVEVLDDVDTQVNDRGVVAERTWAYGWDCSVFSATVDPAVLIPEEG